jgi:CubicO group peptidase (beta-lactamase class C family)
VHDPDHSRDSSAASGTQATLANWRKPPFNKWSFQHVREIVPSADIPNDPDSVWALPSAPVDLSSLSVDDAGTALGFDAFLSETDTDALVVLHRGRIVSELYATGMTRQTPHILMSVSKSVLGILAGILADQSVLDLSAPAATYVPELAGTAYRGATVRDLLDMRAGVLFDENYLATSGPIITYRKAQGWDPLEPGESASDLHSFYQSLTAADGVHGGRFHYVSPNTDLLGWVIERAAGASYEDLLSTLLWQPMGAFRSAYITVDRLGAPRCAGGLCTTAQDLARLGQLIVQRGRREGAQVIPEAWIDDIVHNGDAQAWRQGDFAEYFPDMPIRYRSKWYVLQGDAPMLFCLGVNGQNLFVDPANEIVMAKFSSQAAAMDKRRIGLTMRGVAAIRKHLAV